MVEKNKFYVYVYCNPLKSGIYSYQENGIGIDFPCAPFYIGKGHDIRSEDHLAEAEKYRQTIEEKTSQEGGKPKYNGHKINTINKIIREGEEVIIYKICENLEEETSYLPERFFIKLIGRADLKTGILTNMTDGGDGVRGYIPSDKRRRQLSIQSSGENNPMYGRNDQCYTPGGIVDTAKAKKAKTILKFMEKKKQRISVKELL